MSTTKEYRRIAFLSGPRHPGGMPAAFDTSKGGRILRTTTEHTDDVLVTTHGGQSWEAPWSSVFWAIAGVAGPALQKTRPRFQGRVRNDETPPPPPELETEPDDEPPPSEPKTETRAKPSSDWKPPKKPKQRKPPPPKPAPAGLDDEPPLSAEDAP